MFKLEKWPLRLKLLPHELFISLLLACSLCGLGLRTCHILGSSGLDHTDGNSLSHVSDSKTSEGSKLREGLNTHGLAGNQLNDGGVTRLDELGLVLGRFTCTSVNLFLDFSKLAGNVSSVTIQRWHREQPLSRTRGASQQT